MQLINTQEIEKPVKLPPGAMPYRHELQVNSIFYTMQGEGPFAGRTSVFVRLAGCNLQCPLCDTEYTKREAFRPCDIVDKVVKAFDNAVQVNPFDGPLWYTPKPLVVITGGEPLRQPIENLVEHLLVAGYAVQIETNGTLYRDLPFNNPDLTIVCSPKAGTINKRLMEHVDAFKYVAGWEDLEYSPDGLPMKALDHSNGGGLARPAGWWRGEIYLQPADHKDEQTNNQNLCAVVRSCLQNGYRLCLQMHKYADIE